MNALKVAVIKRTVFGLDGFHARCLTCGWTSRGTGIEAKAAQEAKKHRCESTVCGAIPASMVPFASTNERKA